MNLNTISLPWYTRPTKRKKERKKEDDLTDKQRASFCSKAASCVGRVAYLLLLFFFCSATQF
jgi:hypothetical protein